MIAFIDMDGVLANFQGPAFRVHGIEYDTYPVECGWDIVWACNVLKPGCGMTAAKFWKGLEGKSFWAGLPKTWLCDRLIYELKRLVGYKNMCILSSCNVEGSADGKKAWIREHLPKELWSNCLYGSGAKSFCARPDAILIDDYDLNVDEFRAAGGRAVLVPRPWNRDWKHRLTTDTTIQRLQHEVASLAE